jgi:2-polyprenyl-3-methyl-5-hydroxy-6-metoxy-1,4-benzoquinol methylase
MTVLFDALAATGVLGELPATAEAAAGTLGLDEHAVRVALDALAVWGVVTRDGDGRYVGGDAMPAPEDAPVIRHHARALKGWVSTLDARLHGAVDRPHAPSVEPAVFLDALAVTARETAPAIVDLCLNRFPEASTVLDLGGGHGEYSLEFARRGLSVTMQDLPPMIDVVRRRGRLGEAGVELFEGSFFDAVPDGPFDLAFCCGVTHTFDAERNVTLYRRLHPVVASGGGVAVVTFLRGRRPLADVFAVQMLVNSAGGDTHSEAEYRHWLTTAGFAVDPAPVDLAGRPQSVVFATR